TNHQRESLRRLIKSGQHPSPQSRQNLDVIARLCHSHVMQTSSVLSSKGICAHGGCAFAATDCPSGYRYHESASPHPRQCVTSSDGARSSSVTGKRDVVANHKPSRGPGTRARAGSRRRARRTAVSTTSGEAVSQIFTRLEITTVLYIQPATTPGQSSPMTSS